MLQGDQARTDFGDQERQSKFIDHLTDQDASQYRQVLLVGHFREALRRIFGGGVRGRS